MEQEIEAKFLNQNHDEIRAKLEELGAKCEHPMKLVRRTVFDYTDRRLYAQDSWVRLREELNGTTELMLKQVKSNELGQTFEQPVIVDDFEKAKAFVISLGLEVKGEQESKREVWRLGDVEIMLDEWPWAKPYIEIEAPTEEAVKGLAAQLGLTWEDACFGGITPVYVAEYGITPQKFESLELSMKFDQPVPESLQG